MIEQLGTEAGRALIAQGALGVLLLGAIIVIALQYVEIRNLRTRCTADFKELYDKRLEEQKIVLQTMERYIAANVTLAASVDGGKSTILDLSRLWALSNQAAELSRASIKEQSNRIESRIDAIAVKLAAAA